MKPKSSPAIFSGSLMLLLSLSIAPNVRTANAQQPTEEQAIRELWDRFENFFQEGNSAAIGLLYSEDADRRNGQGEHARGRAEAQQMYEAIFLGCSSRQGSEANRTRFEFEVRFLRLDVALIDGFYIQPTGARGPFTVVTTKENGTWRIIASPHRNTFVGPDGGFSTAQPVRNPRLTVRYVYPPDTSLEPTMVPRIWRKVDRSRYAVRVYTFDT